MNPDTILRVENLAVSFETEAGSVRAVDGVGFAVRRGRTLGIVGESGCGKSVTALAVMRLLPKPAGVLESGRILLDGSDLAELPSEQMPTVRGRRIAMVFQEPMTALNPVHRLHRQLEEVFRLHRPDMAAVARNAAALDLFRRVGIPEPEARLREYPHQISGGMRQRVMIAMALAGRPDLLIADEPTTALDVTIQAQILDLLRQLQDETGMGVIFITHDLGVIAEMCREVIVMYAGRIVESAPVRDLFRRPAHPYTRGLIGAIPRLESQPKTPLPVIRGRVPGLSELPPGCRFANRCPDTMPICHREHPPAVRIGAGHEASCWLYRAEEGPGLG